MAGSGSMSGQSRLAPPSRYDEDNLLLEEETLVRTTPVPLELLYYLYLVPFIRKKNLNGSLKLNLSTHLMPLRSASLYVRGWVLYYNNVRLARNHYQYIGSLVKIANTDLKSAIFVYIILHVYKMPLKFSPIFLTVQ